jgi:hypothetical protein
MAAETGLSQSSVSRIWRAFGLKPHAVETWKLSTDPQFIAKVRDVVGLYMSPPEHALVLAVDEKSQIRALDRTAPSGTRPRSRSSGPRPPTRSWKPLPHTASGSPARA